MSYLSEIQGGKSGPSFIGQVGTGLAESTQAAGYALGVYTPKTKEEEVKLTNRAISDGLFLAAGLLTSGGVGIAVRGLSPLAKIAFTTVVEGMGGAAAGAAVAKMEGEDVLGGAASGGLMGAAGGLIGSSIQAGLTPKVRPPVPGVVPTPELPPLRPDIPTAPGMPGGGQVLDIPNPPPPPPTWTPGMEVPPMRPLHPMEVGPPPLREGPVISPGPKLHGFTSPLGTAPPESGVGPIVDAVGRPSESFITRGPMHTGKATAWYGDGTIVHHPVGFTADILPSEVMDVLPKGMKRLYINEAVPEEGYYTIIDGKAVSVTYPREGSTIPRTTMINDTPTGIKPPKHEAQLREFMNHSLYGRATVAFEGWKKQHVKIGAFLDRLPNSNESMDKIAMELSHLYNWGISAPKNVLRRMGLGSTVDAFERAGENTALKTADQLVKLSKWRHLTIKESENLFDVLDNNSALPLNPRVEELAKSIHGMLDDIGLAMVDHKIIAITKNNERVLAEFRKGYVPYVYKKEYKRLVQVKGSGEWRAAIKKIMDANPSITDKEMADIELRKIIFHPSDITNGPLQHVRMNEILDSKYLEKDIRKIIPHYLYRANQRIAHAVEFGGEYQKLNDVLKEVAAKNLDFDFVEKTFEVFKGTNPHKYAATVGALRSWNVVSMLTYAGLLQPAQLSNIVAYTGSKNLVKAMALLATNPEMRIWARRCGAHLGEMIQDMLPIAEGGVANMHVRLIGLEPLDKANRIIAALAGRLEAEQTWSKFVIKPTKQLRRKLEILGINPEEILSREVKDLTDMDLRKVGLLISRKTQFSADALNSPLFKNTPLGDMLYLFKSFAITQLRFNKELLMEGVKHKNWTPAMKYLSSTLTLGGAVGMGVQEARSIIENKPLDRSAPFAQQYIKAVMDAGTFGLLSNIVNSLEGGKSAVMGLMAGPAIGEMSKLFPEAWEAAKGDPDAFMKHVVKMGGPLGKVYAGYLWPEKP